MSISLVYVSKINMRNEILTKANLYVDDKNILNFIVLFLHCSAHKLLETLQSLGNFFIMKMRQFIQLLKIFRFIVWKEVL